MRRFSWSNNQQSRGFRVIFWTYQRKHLCCDSVGLMITNYLMNGSFSSFLEAESDSQFWDVEDVNVFTGLVVEIRHIASWHQKRHRKNSFSCSIQSSYDAKKRRYIDFLCCISKESYCSLYMNARTHLKTNDYQRCYYLS